MANCAACGKPFINGECSGCGAESTQVTPQLDPHLLDIEVTAPDAPPGLRAGAARRPSAHEIPSAATPPSVAASSRRASWYEMAAAVVTDPKLVVSKPPPPTTTLSGAHMLPDTGSHLVHEGSQLPLILLVAMILRHVALLYMGKLDGSPLAIGILGVAAFCQLTQKSILKPLVGLALLFEVGHSFYLATQVEGADLTNMVPSVAGALAALCAIALMLLSDVTVTRVMLVIGLGAIGGSVIMAQYYGGERGPEPLAAGVYTDATGLTWRVPTAFKLYDARKGLAGYHGPTAGLRAFCVSDDRRIIGGLVAAQLPPGSKLESALPTLDPPPVNPTVVDDLLPDALRYTEAVVYRYSYGGTNLVFLERAGDGRTIAVFLRSAEMGPAKEKEVLTALIGGLTIPAQVHRAARPTDGSLTPLVPSALLAADSGPGAPIGAAPTLSAEVALTAIDAGPVPPPPKPALVAVPNGETQLGAIPPTP